MKRIRKATFVFVAMIIAIAAITLSGCSSASFKGSGSHHQKTSLSNNSK